MFFQVSNAPTNTFDDLMEFARCQEKNAPGLVQ